MNLPQPCQIHLKGYRESDIQVSPYETVGYINEHFNDNEIRLVYKGMLLDPSLSFSYYNIQHDDTIIVVQPRPVSSRKSRREHDSDSMMDIHYERLMKQKKLMMQEKDNAQNDMIALESARLLDLSFNKISYRPTSYRRICKIIKKKSDNLENSFETQGTVLPEKALTPCTEFLPLISSNSDAQSN